MEPGLSNAISKTETAKGNPEIKELQSFRYRLAAAKLSTQIFVPPQARSIVESVRDEEGNIESKTERVRGKAVHD